MVLDKLDEPHGVWPGADGSVCVAEAGRLAEGQKPDELNAPVLANTGAVTCLDAAGHRRRVIDQLPYVL